MMKAAVRYSLLGISGYLLFLVVQFPAIHAYRFAREPLHSAVPQLQLAGIDGSVWSGRVESLVYRKALLGEMSWKLSPLSLLIGEAQIDTLLQSKNGYMQSEVSTPLGGGLVELIDTKGQLPINELTRFTPYMPVALDGTVSVDLGKVTVAGDGQLLRAEGTVIWHQAKMSAPQVLAFGDLQVTLHTETEGQVSGDISDRGGPLKVKGTLNLSPDRSYVLKATVAAAPEAPATLVKSLGWLGKPDAKGSYHLNYSGKM